jgi:dimethylaniline monooxygenase (N-oxide forming)
MMDRQRICIIGGGAAGIAAAAAISRAGISFDWFEGGSQLGGIWRYGNDNGSSVYASLMTNTSQVNMQWFGYPMPTRANDYLTHAQVLEYIENFMAHANLANKVTLSTRVTSVELRPNGNFRASLQSRSSEQFCRDYRAVIVAAGCHSTPKLPKIPGTLNAPIMHASEYRTPEIFAGRRVVITGFGASGADIASDAAGIATSVVLSTRNGGYLLPRYVAGKPRDEGGRAWLSLAPRAVRKQLWRVMLMRRTVSPKVRAALEQHAIPFGKPAVINDRLADLIETDRVVVKPGIERLEGDRVIFSDRSDANCDLLVCATGYEAAYPFLSAELIEQNKSFTHRYLRVAPPNQPGLYFVGHVSILGPIFPILERQATWVADLVSGRCTLPSPMKMQRLSVKESRAASLIYLDAGRGGDTVEYYPYNRALKKEHATGRIRARRVWFAPEGSPGLDPRCQPMSE